MPVTSGADPDLLDALARELTASAERLRALAARLGQQVRSSPWAGRDAEALRSDWTARHERAVTVAATDLDVAATTAARNAVEQRRASEAGGGALGGGAALGGAAGGLALGAVAGGAGGGAGGQGGSGPQPVGTGGFPFEGRPLQLPEPTEGSVEGEFEAGPLSGEGSLSGSLLTGSVEGPEGELTGPTYDPVTGEWTLAEAKVEASAQYAVAEGKAEGSLDLGPAHAEGEASALIGAKADGTAEASIGEDGIKVAGGVAAVAGATAAAKGSVEAFGAKAEAEGHVTAGLEFTAEAEGEVTYEKVDVSVKLGAALGIGGGVDFDVSFEPEEAVNDVIDLFDGDDD